MSVQVEVFPNALDPGQVETYDAVELVPWLMQHFGRWPETARLYHRVGKVEYDVTPEVATDVPALADLEGTVAVRILPAGIDPLTGGVGLVLGAIKLIQSIIPDVPNVKTPSQRARQAGGSPNNSLGKRSNAARPDERVPYILGAVRSIPDLLAVPYTTYENHVEVETAYYCIGVGSYAVQDVRDGDMLVSQIDGASAQVYGPGKAPTGGIGAHDPDITIGDAIADDVYTVYAVEAVNGQELSAWNDYTFYGTTFPQNSDVPLLMSFFDNGDGTGVIAIPFSSDSGEITDRVELGDDLFIFWPFVQPGGSGTPPDLSTPVTSGAGEPVVVTSPTVLSIVVPPDPTTVQLTVSIPSSQQSQWALIQPYFEDLQDPSDIFPYTGGFNEYAQVTPLSHLYQGPFFIDFEHPSGGASSFEIVCNFTAPRGLYADDGVTTRALDVEIQVIVTPADASGNPNGTPQAFQGTLEGSATARGQRALTLRCAVTGLTSTKVLVQARRLTNTPRRQRQTDAAETSVFGANLTADPPIYAHFSGTVVDEVRWTHCYSMSKPGNISFGNVTTIHTRTVATTGALRAKERKLNCFVTRKIQTWDGSTFGGSLVANDRTENCLFTVLKDSTIGGLADANIDFAGIAAAFDQVRTSVFSEFPVGDVATSFNFTFDDADLSLEETIHAICQSAFCIAYRDGDVIKVRPEIAGDDSVLLLNHRNTLIGTQRVTHAFGPPTENDAVEVTYVDPLDNAHTKVTVPKFGSRNRPRQLKVIGLRSAAQAYWHAYRAYHKMLYQRQSLTVEALQESELLGTRQRVLVADETRSGVQTGEVLGLSGDTIRTSQPVALEVGKTYSVHLQRTDGTTESFGVLSAPSTRELELDATPTVVTNPGAGVPTTYLLLADDAPAPTAFLVSSVQPTTPMTHQIWAVNYSHMYYVADGLTTWVDFAHGLSDLSPQQRLFTNNGGTISGGVWTGSSSDYFEVSNPAEDTVTASYSKLLFINATSAPTDSGLIRPASGSDEAFAITPGNLLAAGHNGALQVAVDYSSFVGAEHMVAATYDVATGRLAVLIDGALAGEATVAQAAAGSPLRYLEGFEGTCRVCMKWGRALSDREVREFYLRMRQ